MNDGKMQERAYSNVWDLSGKKAVVTGATKGIGKAIVEEMLLLKAHVLLVARGKDEIEAQVAEYRQNGYLVYGVAADVATHSGRQKVMEAIRRDMGSLDILVNNAGINIRKSTLEYSAEDYDTIMRTNLESGWELGRLCFSLLQGGDALSIQVLWLPGAACAPARQPMP